MPTSGRFEVDRTFVSRLLLGALTEHEQRLLVARLLHRDPSLRQQVLSIIGPFESFDVDLMRQYAAALRHRVADERLRRELVGRGMSRAPDLADLIHRFTYGDVLRLGPVTQRLFSWTMAELLLERGGRGARSEYEEQIDLYLALMVIDVVDILGSSGKDAHYPEVVEDVRRRIRRAVEEATATG